MNIEFISYDGRYPTLCSGTLILSIDGKPRKLKDCLCSGGSATFDKNGDECVTKGRWKVELPKDLSKHYKKITKLVNDNIPHGCCGGCI